MSKNEIPRELKMGLTDDNVGQSQWVETRTLEPVAGANQQSVSWLLPREGILDDAFISFQIQAVNNNVHLPLWAGAMSAFDSAELKCGGQTLCTSRGINHLFTLKSFYRDPQERDQKICKRLGTQTSLMVDKRSGDAQIDSGVWGVDVGQDSVAEDTANTRFITQGYRITDQLTNADPNLVSSEWHVDLAMLFPLLYQNKLPLSLLKDQISIQLNLQEEQTRGDRVVCADGVWAKGTSYQNFKLHCDLVFYDDELGGEGTMERLQKSLNSGVSLPYTDYTYIEKQVPAGDAAAGAQPQQINTLCGLDNQIVRRIFCSTPEAPDYGGATPGQNSGNALLGNYHSLGSNLQNTLQVTINSNPYYSQPLNTDGKIQNQLNQTFPMAHKINQAISSAQGQVDVGTGAYVVAQSLITNKTLNGVAQSVQANCGHYYGIPLTRSFVNAPGQGTAVGKQNVSLALTDKRVATGNDPKVLHIWAECERSLLMAHGKVVVVGA